MPEPCDKQVVSQHYLVCGTKDCKQNCQFYCNDCHQPICKKCRDIHSKLDYTKLHESVLYQQSRQQIPSEKCEEHPPKNKDSFCR